jgi:hypothetical protein
VADAFPVLPRYGEYERRTVPWDFVRPYEARAQKNHDQTLEVLAARGGMSECELIALAEDRPWKSMDARDARARLAELVARWEVTHG